MPKLLVFAPCQSVLIDSEDSIVSMVQIIEHFGFSTQKQELDAGSGIPFGWAVLSLWLRQDGDEGKVFEQRVELIDPSGAVRLRSDATFEMGARTLRQRLNIGGMPIQPQGEYNLRLSLRESEGQHRVVAEWPFQIQRASGQPG